MFFKHGVQMGVRLTQAKLNALADGDLSGKVIHPIFVHLAHLYGSMLLRRDPDDVPSSLYPDEELSYLTVILDALHSSSLETIDPVFRVRAHGLLALYFYYKRDVFPARDQMDNAARLIESEGLKIERVELGQASTMVAVGNLSRGTTRETIALMAAVSEEDEKRSILAHMVYVDRCAEALMKSAPQIPKRLDGEFMVLMVNSLPPCPPRVSDDILTLVDAIAQCESSFGSAQFGSYAYEQYLASVRDARLYATVEQMGSRYVAFDSRFSRLLRSSHLSTQLIRRFCIGTHSTRASSSVSLCYSPPSNSPLLECRSPSTITRASWPSNAAPSFSVPR